MSADVAPLTGEDVEIFQRIQWNRFWKFQRVRTRECRYYSLRSLYANADFEDALVMSSGGLLRVSLTDEDYEALFFRSRDREDDKVPLSMKIHDRVDARLMRERVREAA